MRLTILILLLLNFFQGHSQTGWWRAALHRPDSQKIIFNFEWKKEQGKDVWYIRNASERIRVDAIEKAGDSLIVQMPLFESQFRLVHSSNKIEGKWIKGGASRTQVLPFSAEPGKTRFEGLDSSWKNIAGRWDVTFYGNSGAEQSVAEFKQMGSLITGSFLNSSGDFRYLEGIVKGDSLFLSCFDGSHAFLIIAKIESNNKIIGGKHYAGELGKRDWTAIKNPKAKLSYDSTAIYLKPGEDRLNFTFNDLEGHPVSINDQQFKDKVVVIQLMGSWCPNCMDETAFLSNYYNKHKDKVAVISLAYEYSTDIDRSRKGLRKFQKRFNVQYPMLITTVAVNDSLRTEKTLPQITRIKSFPSTIFIDKKGKVRKLDTSFNGPGTGAHYETYKKEFEETIERLLKES